jgi:hypothetical protein
MYASLGEFLRNVFLRASSDKMELVISKYFMAAASALHTVVTKVFQDGGRLLISSTAFSSSSIVIPCGNSWEMIPLYSFR